MSGELSTGPTTHRRVFVLLTLRCHYVLYNRGLECEKNERLGVVFVAWANDLLIQGEKRHERNVSHVNQRGSSLWKYAVTSRVLLKSIAPNS